MVNLRPMFSQGQLDTTTSLIMPTLQAASTIDTRTLVTDIKGAVLTNPALVKLLEPGGNANDPHWSVEVDGSLLYDRRTFVPDTNNLHLQVLRTKHDHQLAGHMGQAKTYQLVCRDYSWPHMQEFIRDYIKTCSVCTQNKPRRHRPYGLLKQLPIPPQPQP